MNPQMLRPGNIAAATVVIGGTLVLVLPQRALSIVRVMMVTMAAAAGLYALGRSAPPTWWFSPFDRMSGPEKGSGSGDIEWIRSELSGWRQRIPNGPPLPPGVLRVLRPLVEGAVERAGIDPVGVARRFDHTSLSPVIRAVLMSDPSKGPRWFRMVWPDRRGTATAVHRILDEVDRLTDGITRNPPIETRDPRVT